MPQGHPAPPSVATVLGVNLSPSSKDRKCCLNSNPRIVGAVVILLLRVSKRAPTLLGQPGLPVSGFTVHSPPACPQPLPGEHLGMGEVGTGEWGRFSLLLVSWAPEHRHLGLSIVQCSPPPGLAWGRPMAICRMQPREPSDSQQRNTVSSQGWLAMAFLGGLSFSF